MGTPTITNPHIVKEPDYCGGKAAIDDTGVRVMNVVFLHKQGKNEAGILEAYPDLDRAQLYAALAYYYTTPRRSTRSSAPTKRLPIGTSETGPAILLGSAPGSGEPLPTLHGRRRPGPGHPSTEKRRLGCGESDRSVSRAHPDPVHFERAFELRRVLVTNDEGQRQRARDWYREGRVFPGLIWWPQVDYLGKTPGDFLRAFEELAEQEDPFSPYPIVYLIAKRR